MSRYRVSRKLLASILFVCAPQALGQTTAQCERAAIHFESQAEGILAQRGVLEVVRTRAKLSGKSVCKVLLEPSQFPWANSETLKIRLALRQKARYDVVRGMSSDVLPDRSYIYFNNPAHPWSYKKRRIGKITFNNVKEK